MQTNFQADPNHSHTRSPESISALKVLHSLPDPVLVNETEASLLLDRSPATLARWRAQGKGPAVTKVGTRSVAYTMGALRSFVGLPSKPVSDQPE